MASQDTTARFRVDISDLKKNIQEANRQIRLVNAEFKAAASGMEDWEKSSEGVQKKVEQLDKVLEAQNKILKSYEDQLELITKEYGENSKEADEMRIKVANQQAVVNKTTSELEKYRSVLNELQAAEEKAADGTEDQVKAYDDMGNAVKEQQKRLDDLKGEYKNVVLEQGKNSDSAKDLARQIDDLSSELKQNKDAMEEADDAADDLDNSLNDLDPEGTANGFTILKGAIADLVSKGIQMAISALKDFVAETVKIGQEFDTSMSQVSAVSGATGDELQMLRDKAKEMGETTAFSASEAADAFNYMAMAGWKSEEMVEGIGGILNLAAASGTDLATTSDIVTDALTGMGYSAQDAGKLADVMAAASSNANTNVEMMGETFKYVAPLIGSMGYSMEDTAVAVGLMANAGIKGSQAGTALRASLTKLVKPSKEGIGVLEELGIVINEVDQVIDPEKVEKAGKKVSSATASMEKAQISYNEAVKKHGENSAQAQKALINLTQAKEKLAEANEELAKAQEGEAHVVSSTNTLLSDENGNMRSLSEVLQVLRSSFADLSEEEQAQAAATLFGQEAMSGMLAIINASEEDFNKLTKAVKESDGAAQRMADTMLDNLGGDMTLFKSKLEGVQLSLYEKFEPALRKGVEALSGFLDVVNWFIDHGDKVVATLAAMGAAIAAYLAYTTALKVMREGWMALEIVQKAVTAAQWLMNAAMAANPIGIIVAAIAALVAGFLVLWNTSEDFRNFWISLWEDIVAAFLKVGDWISEVFNAIVAFFKDNWQSILLFLINPFAGLFKYCYEHFEGFRNFVNGIINAIKGFFEGLWNALKSGAETSWSVIMGIWSAVGEWFKTNVVDPVTTFFTEGWENLKKGASDAWEGIKSVFAKVGEFFGNTFKNAWEKVKTVFSTGGKIFDGIKEGITEAFKTVVNAIIKGINKVVAIPFTAINKALDTIREINIAGVKPFSGLIPTIAIPEIPLLARGGVLGKGQMGLLEGDGAEAVVPLDQNQKWVAAVASELRQSLAAEGLLGFGGEAGAVGGASYTFIQNNNSPKALDRLEIYRQTRNQLELAKGV